MGEVVEINGNIITIRFQDGSCRKYLKENFIREPFINQKVQINSDGTLIDLDEKNKSAKKMTTILIIFIIIITIGLGVSFISCAISAGRNVNSCITDCPG